MPIDMSGQTGIKNLLGMRNRKKGGLLAATALGSSHRFSHSCATDILEGGVDIRFPTAVSRIILPRQGGL